MTKLELNSINTNRDLNTINYDGLKRLIECQRIEAEIQTLRGDMERDNYQYSILLFELMDSLDDRLPNGYNRCEDIAITITEILDSYDRTPTTFEREYIVSHAINQLYEVEL